MPRTPDSGDFVVRKPRPQKVFPFSSLLELLAANGLTVPESVSQLESWSPTELASFAADFFDFIEQTTVEIDRHSAMSPFTALAGASIRGDAACQAPPCKKAKLESFERFAALYADKIFLPLPLPNPGSPELSLMQLRWRTVSTVFTILQLQRTIRAGIVVPIGIKLHYCLGCSDLARREWDLAITAARDLARTHEKEFEFEYEDYPKSHAAVFIKGPERYLEHGSGGRFLEHRPDWFPRTRASSRRRLPITAARRGRLVEDIFESMAADVFFHEGYSGSSRTTYLTDLAGEVELLRKNNERDATASATNRFLAELTHEVPLFADVSIEDALALRSERPEAFQSYRSAISGIVRDQLARSPEECVSATSVYDEFIAPALDQLKQQEANEKTRWKKKSLITCAFTGGIVTLGMAGLLPTASCLALAGGATMMKLVDQLSDTPGTTGVANHNLYFLLQLERHRKSQSKRGGGRGNEANN